MCMESMSQRVLFLGMLKHANYLYPDMATDRVVHLQIQAHDHQQWIERAVGMIHGLDLGGTTVASAWKMRNTCHSLFNVKLAR